MPETWQLTSRSFALVGKTTYAVNSYSSKQGTSNQTSKPQYGNGKRNSWIN
jgi:hypothetical protein